MMAVFVLVMITSSVFMAVCEGIEDNVSMMEVQPASFPFVGCVRHTYMHNSSVLNYMIYL